MLNATVADKCIDTVLYWTEGDKHAGMGMYMIVCMACLHAGRSVDRMDQRLEIREVLRK